MKKKIILSLAGLFLLTLAACGSQTVSCGTTPPEATSGTEPVTVAEIVDLTKDSDISTDTALEPFHEDECGEYAFGSIKSQYVIVKYSDGSQKPVKEALSDGDITMADLDRFDIGYLTTVLKAPPALTVIRGEESIEALKGGYSWILTNGDGTSTATIADSAHPLQCRDIMPSLSLTPSPLSHIDPVAAYMKFPVAPNTVSVRCWDESCWDSSYEATIASEELPVTVTEEGLFRFTLKDSGHIYEVTAEWNDFAYQGTASYSFYTTAPDMALHPVAE